MPDRARILTKFNPGSEDGRQTALYILTSNLTPIIRRREIFILNLGVELLLKSGYTLNSEDKTLRILDEKEEKYQVIVDAEFLRAAEEWDNYEVEIKKKIDEAKRKNLQTIILVADEHAVYNHCTRFPNASVIDLYSHFHRQ